MQLICDWCLPDLHDTTTKTIDISLFKYHNNHHFTAQLQQPPPLHNPITAIIACDGFSKFEHGFAEDYCWTQGIYTVKEAYDHLLVNVPYPGEFDWLSDSGMCRGLCEGGVYGGGGSLEVDHWIIGALSHVNMLIAWE